MGSVEISNEPEEYGSLQESELSKLPQPFDWQTSAFLALVTIKKFVHSRQGGPSKGRSLDSLNLPGNAAPKNPGYNLGLDDCPQLITRFKD